MKEPPPCRRPTPPTTSTRTLGLSRPRPRIEARASTSAHLSRTAPQTTLKDKICQPPIAKANSSSSRRLLRGQDSHCMHPQVGHHVRPGSEGRRQRRLEAVQFSVAQVRLHRSSHRLALARYAVTERTRATYRKALAKMDLWLKEEMVGETLEELVDNTSALDETIAEYFDHLCLELHSPVHAGTLLLAALGDKFVCYLGAVRHGLLPHVARSLQGWQKVHPNGMRMPWPLPAVMGVIMEMMRRGHTNMAQVTALAVDTYMRPGELLGLRTTSLVPARPELGPSYRHWAILVHPWAHGRASKVGEFDESILLDSPSRPWIGRIAARLRQDNAKREFVANFSYREWAATWRSCASSLGLPAETLYVMRHTGASDDWLRRARSIAEIKRRGRWASDRSLKRYEKSARTMAVMQTWPPQLLQYLRKCELVIGRVLLKLDAPLDRPANLPRVLPDL